MPEVPKPRSEPSEIGQRARMIRRRRGLSLDAAAGLPADRDIAEGKRIITRHEHGLNAATLEDVPDIQPRSLDELR